MAIVVAGWKQKERRLFRDDDNINDDSLVLPVPPLCRHKQQEHQQHGLTIGRHGRRLRLWSVHCGVHPTTNQNTRHQPPRQPPCWRLPPIGVWTSCNPMRKIKAYGYRFLLWDLAFGPWHEPPTIPVSCWVISKALAGAVFCTWIPCTCTEHPYNKSNRPNHPPISFRGDPPFWALACGWPMPVSGMVMSNNPVGRPSFWPLTMPLVNIVGWYAPIKLPALTRSAMSVTTWPVFPIDWSGVDVALSFDTTTCRNS